MLRAQWGHTWKFGLSYTFWLRVWQFLTFGGSFKDNRDWYLDENN